MTTAERGLGLGSGSGLGLGVGFGLGLVCFVMRMFSSKIDFDV